MKKAKLNELQQYIQQNQPLPSDVMECYQQIQKYRTELPSNKENISTSAGKIGPLQQALTKRKGTLSVIAEYKRPVTVTSSPISTTTTTTATAAAATGSTTSSSIWDIDVLSPIFREAGVTGIAIMADAKMGGCNYEHDLPFCVQEQNRIRKSNVLPGPMYIVNSDVIVDPIQIARTAAIRHSTSNHNNKKNNNPSDPQKSEIAAIVLQYSVVVTADDTTLLVELIQSARALDMEVIVTVTDPQQAQTAVNLGVSIICVMAPVVVGGDASSMEQPVSSTGTTTSTTKLRTNNTFVDAQIACIENIQYPDDNQNVCFLAHIPVKSDNTQWNEIEDVWYIRDTHMFQGIYVSDILYKGQVASTTFTGSNDSMEHPGSIIKAMISKSSKLWGVVTTKSGRGEGAREYLGDIMM